MCTLLQSAYPITKCVPYYKEYLLIQSAYPITKCVPYYKVCTLLRSVYPVTRQYVYPVTKCIAITRYLILRLINLCFTAAGNLANAGNAGYTLLTVGMYTCTCMTLYGLLFAWPDPLVAFGATVVYSLFTWINDPQKVRSLLCWHVLYVGLTHTVCTYKLFYSQLSTKCM